MSKKGDSGISYNQKRKTYREKSLPGELKLVRVNAKIAQRDANRLGKRLHTLDQVEPAHQRRRTCKQKHREILRDPGVRHVLGVHKRRADRVCVGIARLFLLF